MGDIGRDDWIRTSDPLTPSQVRYQAALHPENFYRRRSRSPKFSPAVAPKVRRWAEPVGRLKPAPTENLNREGGPNSGPAKAGATDRAS